MKGIAIQPTAVNDLSVKLATLRDAALEGNVEQAECVIDELACHLNSVQLMSLGMQNGLDLFGIPSLSAKEWPLLHLAAANNRAQMVHLLLYRRIAAHGDVGGRERRTALHWAADCGYVKVLIMLLSHGADCEVTDSQGLVPLILAAANGHTACVEELVVAGAKLSSIDPHEGATAMHFAAINGHGAATPPSSLSACLMK
eukprot:SAG31_NODE_164_length_21790_cov_26.291411_6_plen_200_part_00